MCENTNKGRPSEEEIRRARNIAYVKRRAKSGELVHTEAGSFMFPFLLKKVNNLNDKLKTGSASDNEILDLVKHIVNVEVSDPRDREYFLYQRLSLTRQIKDEDKRKQADDLI